MEFRPQKGQQERFLSSSADIVIYGGAAGGGKTYSILLEPLRHLDNPKFTVAVFRQTNSQIFTQGGLWDKSEEIYPYFGARSVKTPSAKWTFPSGMDVTFNYLNMDKDVLKWQGSEIALIMFDELTHFTLKQFIYMLSRNRSLSGVRPYIRATCNPDSDSWVAELISWWIDEETGYPIPERGGVIRYFARIDDAFIWGDTREELIAKGINARGIKSFTFIPSSIFDNQILLEQNPEYLANLEAQSLVERERLLYGNWKIRPAAGLVFPKNAIELIQEVPTDIVRVVRGWDLAATDVKDNSEAAYTAGVLIGKRKSGAFVILDVKNVQMNASSVRKLIWNTAVTDQYTYKDSKIILPQDPGQAGKDQAESFVKFLAGFDVNTELESGSKIERANPMAAQWQIGNIQVLQADWTKSYLEQMNNFPESKFKDMVDASSKAFNFINKARTIFVPPTDSILLKDKKEWGTWR